MHFSKGIETGKKGGLLQEYCLPEAHTLPTERWLRHIPSGYAKPTLLLRAL